MIKKAGWIFVGVYVLVILYLNIAALINPDSDGFTLNTIVSLLLTLLPAGAIAFELAGKKVWLLIILPAFLITAIFFLGILNFNSLSLETVAKAVLFGVTLLILGYMGVKRIRKK